ncbi:hypothetical protein [Sphingomonas lenta]|uniref:hypothetical protein n=1 Tax=Sphingomonas lenta TaxID=1141887 RepID=UPI0011409FC6|nr:hypothetical protein [Sphingomonas lenta]
MAFLFLGETLLIPHLFPIVEALAELAPDVRQDLWVSTATTEALLAGWLGQDRSNIRIRRAPGFRPGPELPAKLPMLARLAPRLLRTPVAVCAEQTSLWLPRVLPMRTRFVKTSHGVGSMSARDDPRRRAAWRMLVPSEAERRTYLDRGFAPDRVAATGYVKASFRQRTHARPPFADDRPVLLYTPHWQRYRSSWWEWGREVVARLVAAGRWNLILAPHQRLVERAPDLRRVLAEVAHLPHVHADIDSFACVDGSYTAAADIYLGDTSSQVIEFLQRPRPAVFLNPRQVRWEEDPSYAQWRCGEVVDALDDLLPALGRAAERHAEYAAVQARFAAEQLGPLDGRAPERVAGHILEALDARA